MPITEEELTRQMLEAERAGLCERVVDEAGRIIGWKITEAGRAHVAGRRD